MRAMINGFEMAFGDEGEGLAVVLIHGYPLQRAIWAPQVEASKTRFRVITPDLRGFGESEVTAGPYTMEMLAADVHALLQQRGVRSAVIGGHSMGGYVALAFARQFPEMLRGLILVNTRAGADSPAGKANRQAAAAVARQQGALAVADDMLPKLLAPATFQQQPQLVAHVHRLMAAASVEALANAQLGMATRGASQDVLEGLFLPVLVITGADDKLIPPAESEAMARTVPGARLVVLEDAGHLASLEAPAAFNTALWEFLTVQVA
ncbi:MAG: alpha/beta fold hydrolase [Anaerolineae bacterium]